ncbi:MAG: tRNA (adenosine(37)-N6)-threonylcarbamoyltransferase complex dimerization subunit type 1 TsaB, partial [Chitinophagaceae bacterium]
MATLLHIDTALEEAIVCISNNGILIGCLKNNNQQSHASFLQPAIKKLLQQHKISLSSINAVAVTLGPGSYTGIRVGLASAKGLCFALDKPLIGISTLQVLAPQSIINTKTENDNVLYIPM